jgi:hypothetical protein
MLSIDCIASTFSIELYSNKLLNKIITCEVKPASKEIYFLVKVRDTVVYEAALLETAISIYNKIALKKGIEDFLDSPHRENWKLFYDDKVYFTHSFGESCHTYWKNGYTCLRDKSNDFDSNSWKESLSDFAKRVPVLFV